MFFAHGGGHRADRCGFRPGLESLESRVLLSAGALDPTFGTGGKVLTGVQGSRGGAAQAVVVQADGKIVTAGPAGSGAVQGFGLTRYNADGSLDKSFGAGGTVLTPFPHDVGDSTTAAGLAVQAGGKIVVVGTTGGFGNSSFAVARYTAGGRLDPSFGNGGEVTFQFDGLSSTAAGVAVQSDGKVLVVGSAVAGGVDLPPAGHFALARLNPDGSPDLSFGQGGEVVTSFGFTDDRANAVVLQHDGKIVVAGSSSTDNQGDIALARYKPDGSLDASFGQGGEVTTNFPLAYSEAVAVALQGDGKLVVAGDDGVHPMLVRYRADGRLDTSFGSGGRATLDLGTGAGPFATDERASGIALQADGKIVITGSLEDPDGARFFLARFTQRGQADTSFGGKGTRIVSPGANGLLGDLHPGVAVQRDGRVVVAAAAGTSSNSTCVVLRFRADGSPDAAFDGGRVTTAFPGPVDVGAAGVVVQPDGKVIVAASSANGNLVLVRYVRGGGLDRSFGKGGMVVSPFSGLDGVKLQADGRILVFGSRQGPSGFQAVLARFNADGSLDTHFGKGGTVVMDAGFADVLVGPAVVPLANGKIVVAGPVWGADGFELAVARLKPDGSPDRSFGKGGQVRTGFPKQDVHATAAVVQPDGRVVVAGWLTPVANPAQETFVLVRYRADGSLDPTFGAGGKVVSPFAANHRANTGLLLQPDGKIVAEVASDQYFSAPGQTTFALARFNANGSVDTAFGTRGKVVTDLATGVGHLTPIALRADGKIVVAGSLPPGIGPTPSPPTFTVEQFNRNGRPDLSFGLSGKVSTDFAFGPASAVAVAVGPDGNLVVAGTAPGALGASDIALARYLEGPARKAGAAGDI